MPRDLIREAEIQTKPDLSKPSLEGLAWLLRHEEEWAAKHTWEFGNWFRKTKCGTAGCAYGLGMARWNGEPMWVRIYEAMPCKSFESVFHKGCNDLAIVPSVIASRIDDYLAGRPIRYLVEGDRS